MLGTVGAWWWCSGGLVALRWPIRLGQVDAGALERLALSGLEPNTSQVFLGSETPGQRMAELKQERTSLGQLSQSFQAAVPSLSEAEQENFMERQNILGEVAAMRWVVEQHSAGT